jgi:hypothetical protein
MSTAIQLTTLVTFCILSLAPAGAAASDQTADFTTGTPGILSMGTLEFGPDGILFIGDSRGSSIFAIETGDRTPGDRTERFSVTDIEGKIGALLGTTAGDILIHDMAVNPISRNVYVSVSRARADWESKWYQPNDLADANIILRINTDDTIEELKLQDVGFVKKELSNPIGEDKVHRWKEGLSLRVDAITNLVYDEGTLYVSGLSNEEFSATLWHLGFPFEDDAEWGTLEIYHGAHGAWETFAPIRAFLPYEFKGEEYVLASYLCTPLVTFPMAAIKGGDHVKGHTVAEFGSGNFPLDLVSVSHEGQEFFVMANSQLPLMTFTPQSVEEYMGRPGITREVPTYTEGVPYTPRAATGVMQLDNFNDQFVVVLQRMPSGKLDLVSLSVDRLAL